MVTNACVACNDTTNCATCTSASAGTCTKCLNSKVLVSGVCNTGVTNCKTDTDATTYNTHNGTAYVCSECDTTSTYYIKNTAGTSCLSCSAVSNCTTYVAVDTACGCSLCKIDLTTSPESYYYLTGTGA